MAGKKFSWKEKRAYYMGLGAAIGFGRVSGIKKVADKMSKEEKRSFYNGFDDYSANKKVEVQKSGRKQRK